MATAIGKEDDLISMLNNLIALDYDEAEAYGLAVRRMINVSDQNELRRFMVDYERQAQDLSMVVRDMGGVPPTHSDFRRVLPKGRVAIAEIIGDYGVLGAMMDNEDDANKAYERALGREDLPADTRDILQHHLQVERRHSEWLGQRMESM